MEPDIRTKTGRILIKMDKEKVNILFDISYVYNYSRNKEKPYILKSSKYIIEFIDIWVRFIVNL